MSMSGQNFLNSNKEMFFKSKSSKYAPQEIFSQSMAQPMNNFASSKTFTSNNNENPLNQSAPLLFRERSGKLRWKEVQRLDLDTIAKTNDLTPIEGLLDNLVFANVDENDMQVMPENSVVKLVKTYQYVLEYLLFTQQKIDSENKIYENNYKTLINEATWKENALKENKAIINTLKKDNKQKEQIITTYKYLLDEYKKGNLEAKVKPQVWECAICEDKKFVSKDSLIKHYQRRHPKTNYANDLEMLENEENIAKQFYSNTNAVIGNKMMMSGSAQNFNKNNTVRENQKINEIEKNIEEMKHHFEGFLKSNINEHYNKLYETQKFLENNVMELKGDKSKLSQIESAINKMMKKINKIKDKTKEREKEPSVNMSTPMSEKFKEESFIQHTEKLNQQITDVYRYNNQKIDKISENLEDFKKVIMSQLEEVVKKNNRSNLIKEQIDYNKEDTKRSANPQNQLLSQNAEKLEISRNYKEEQGSKEEFTEPKRRFFNASRHIESDNSEDERFNPGHVPDRSAGEEKQNTDPQKGLSRHYTQPPSDFSKSNKGPEKDSSSVSNPSPKKKYQNPKEIEYDDTIEDLSEKKIVVREEEPKNNTREVMRGKLKSAFTLKENNAKEIKDESYLSQNEKIKIKEDISSITATLKKSQEEEEDEKIPEKMDNYYYNFGMRENDIYLNKLKIDNYYQIKNSDYSVKEDIAKFIETSISEKLISWNSDVKINFEDISTAQTEQIMNLIKNIKDETSNKCENNQYYKIYFEKLISELKLEEYIKICDKPVVSKNQIKNANIKLKEAPKSSYNLSNRENDELANLKKEINSKINKNTRKTFDLDDELEGGAAFAKKSKAIDKLDNDEFDI